MFKENKSWKQFPHFAHGCRANHSREEAIIVAMIASDKLKHAGYSHVNVFHDMTNAFLCTPHSTLNENARNNCIARDAKLLQQRHEEASIVLECPDRKYVSSWEKAAWSAIMAAPFHS